MDSASAPKCFDVDHMTTRSPAKAPFPPAVVLGGGPTGLGVVRELGISGVPVIVCDHNPDNLAFNSKYVCARVVTSADHPERALDQLRDIARQYPGKAALIPCSDWFLELLSRYRRELAEYFQFNIPAADVVDTVVSKQAFGAFALAQNLPVARTVMLGPDSLSTGDSAAPDLDFPVVAKPTHSGGWRQLANGAAIAEKKMLRLDTPDALRDLLRRHPAVAGNAVLQEYIDGSDADHYSYVAYIDREGRELAGFGVRKLRINPIHSGVATFTALATDPQLTHLARAVIAALQYRGVVSVCFKYCRSRQRYLCHEVNGRMPLSHATGLLCGVSLASVAYQDVCGATLPERHIRSRPEGRWLRLEGDLTAFRDYRRSGELSTLQWLASLVKTREHCEWSLRDPAPFFHLLMARLGSRFSR
jgi:D-aspartate ligase